MEVNEPGCKVSALLIARAPMEEPGADPGARTALAPIKTGPERTPVPVSVPKELVTTLSRLPLTTNVPLLMTVQACPESVDGSPRVLAPERVQTPVSSLYTFNEETPPLLAREPWISPAAAPRKTSTRPLFPGPAITPPA